MERKGASYRITSTRPAQDPNAHAQVTKATSWVGQRQGGYRSQPERDPDRDREDQYDREWQEREDERNM